MNLLDLAFRASLSQKLFSNVFRAYLYKKYKDAEEVHDQSKLLIKNLTGKFKDSSDRFDQGEELQVRIDGIPTGVLGLAAGFDKDCEILSPLSYLFGYLTPGTIVKNARPGNPRPRVIPSEKEGALYSGLGFPSKGLACSLEGLKAYKGKAALFASVAGIPANDDPDLAIEELVEVTKEVAPHVRGLEYNPSSPNTKSLALLRGPEMIKQAAEGMKAVAKGRPLFLKLQPYFDDGAKNWLDMVRSWHDNGGTGVAFVNGFLVDPPIPLPCGRLGIVGKPLFSHLIRTLRVVRENFPDLSIKASGGIWDGDDAYKILKGGATLLDIYTVLTFKGFGVIIEMKKTLKKRLHQDGLNSVQELMERSKRASG